MGYIIVFFILSIHLLISYSACLHYCKSYSEKLGGISMTLVILLSGPLTVIATLVVIFITPLRNTSAGILDGGGTLFVLLSLCIFPFVSKFLAWQAFKMQRKRKLKREMNSRDGWEA